MSQKETTGTIGRLEAGESQDVNLPELTELAREAFEQKRTKDCLDLTRAILLVDPGNADAQAMRLAIQSEMHRDLDNARAFIRQAQIKESLKPPLNPEGNEAPEVLVADEVSVKERIGKAVSGAVLLLSDFVYSRRRRGVRWLLVAAAMITVGVVLVPFPRFKTSTPPVESSLLALGSSDVPRPDLSAASDEIQPPIAETPLAVASVSPVVPLKTPAPVPITLPRTAAAPPDVPVAVGTGILAVSSSSSVDIYEKDTYLGSVPVSLELPAGEHTLEYRHGTLRKFVTHTINRNETAKAMVVFDVTVQVNSKPWSEVFLEGVERKDLGQTPLSGVRVPIGGVLVFEIPQFQAKRYRITGNESGIQVVFP
jgi:hypothetical protein